MDVIGTLFGGGAKSALEGLGTLATSIRTAIVGPELTPEQKTQIEMQLLAMEAAAKAAAANYDTEQMRGQIDLNKIEAADASLFKSGWRPAAAWMCVAGLGYTYLVKPILPWVIEVFGVLGSAWFGLQAVPIPKLPEIPMGDLIVLLGGMLGLGVMRSADKYMRRKASTP